MTAARVQVLSKRANAVLYENDGAQSTTTTRRWSYPVIDAPMADGR